MEGAEHVENETFTTEYIATISANFSRSISNETVENCKWNGLNTAMTVLLLFTFLLNAAASFVLFRVPLVNIRGTSNPVYFCIRFLNICDVLQAFFLVIMPAFATNECGWLGDMPFCRVMGFIVLFFLLVSPLITILMAFDRAVALYFPFKYRSNLGLKMLKFSLPSACVLVLVCTVLPIVGIGEYHVVKGRRFCLLDTITEDKVDRMYVIAVHSIFLVALFFMLACTVAFQFKLATMSFTKKHKESKSKNRKKVSSKRTRNATLTTMGICGIFILCYMPYVVRVLVEAVTLKKSPSVVTWLTFGLAFLQPLLNPCVCIGTNARYRKELMALIKNIKINESDTDSESGTINHHFTRGVFSGFRRRLSSGGSRGSKRGSKRKHLGSRTSINNHSATSPQQSHFAIGNGVDKRASWKRHSKLPIPGTENLKLDKNATLKTFIQVPNDELKAYQEHSSSSGVRSYESVDKMFLTSPAIAAALATFTLPHTQRGLLKYGRSLRRDSGLSGPKYRERSHTVSGGEKSLPEIETGSKDHCVSTPMLNESGNPLDDSERDVGEARSDVIVVHGGSPRNFIMDEHHSSSIVDLDIPVRLSSCEDSDNITDAFFTAPEAPSSPISNGVVSNSLTGNDSQLNRGQCRPSYKKALSISSRYNISRKPSKRDSGVGDS